MAKNMFLNVLYNIVIFICLITGYQYGIEQKQYWYILGAVIIIAIFITLKIRLLKQVKSAQKKP